MTGDGGSRLGIALLVSTTLGIAGIFYLIDGETARGVFAICLAAASLVLNLVNRRSDRSGPPAAAGLVAAVLLAALAAGLAFLSWKARDEVGMLAIALGGGGVVVLFVFAAAGWRHWSRRARC